MFRTLTLAAAVLLTLSAIGLNSLSQSNPLAAGQQEQEKQQEKDKTIPIPSLDPDSISRRDFMRTKLMYSQNVLEGITTGNFRLVEKAVAEIQSVTAGAQWVAIDNENYRRLTEDFQLAAERLMEAAKSENVDATALRFYDLSTRCIDCHKHLSKSAYEY